MTGTNSFAGGATLLAGTLALANSTAAGTGTIDFGPSAGLVLEIGHGDTPANTIAGFVAGETIDLAGIGTATRTTLLSGNTLEAFNATGSLTLNLAPGQNYSGEGFEITADGAGGSDLTVINVRGSVSL